MATSTLTPNSTETQQAADSATTPFQYNPNRVYSEHPQGPEPTHPDLIWTKTTMRGYEKIQEIKSVLKGPDGKPLLDAEGKEVFSVTFNHTRRSQAETQTGDNWKKLEKQGFVKTNENQVRRPSVRSIPAAIALFGGDTQRMIEVLNDGIDYNCNSLSNQAMNSLVENTGSNNVPAIPIHNDEVLELWELLQERKRGGPKLTPVEFVMKQLAKLNLGADVSAATLQEVMARLAAQPQALSQLPTSVTESTEGDETSPSEGENEGEDEGEENEEVPA